MDHGVANGIANGIANGLASGVVEGKNGMILNGRNGILSKRRFENNKDPNNGHTYQLYEVEEVSEHANVDDCWVIHQNNVYDVTSFLDTHPGGSDLILTHAGSDITDVLSDEGTHKHTSCAYNLLRDYQIGRLNTRTEEGLAEERDVEKNVCVDYNDLQGWNEELVDWNRGLVFQVHKFGEDYLKWVHSPVNRNLKLFDSNFIEFFSKTKWYVIPVVWIPVVLICSVFAMSQVSRSLQMLYPTDRTNSNFFSGLAFLLLFAMGVPLWTLMEYILHRYLFHLEPNGNSPVMITIHFFFHGQHHKVPFDKDRLVFPPVAAGLFALIFWRVFSFILPGGVGASLCCGGMLGYIGYDLIHYYMHHGTPAKGSYMHTLKHYHVLHHFDDHDTGFGISTKLWDYPFDTVNKKLL